MAIPAEIIVTASDGAQSRYKMGKRAVIGRHPECEIVLSDPMSSRRHCIVDQKPDGGIFVQDNGSANGTLLNNQPLKTPTPMHNGDTIQIGSTLLVLRVDVSVVRNQTSTQDISVSIVGLDDEGGNAPNVISAQKADAQMVTEAEALSSDVEELKRVTERLKLLIDVGQAMGTTLDPHKLLQTCLDKLFEVFTQADRGIIVLYGPDGSLPETLTSEAEQGPTLDRRKGAITKAKFRQSSVQDNEIRLSRTVLNRVRKDRQSVLVTDTDAGNSREAPAESLARFEIKSLMCAPLLIGKDDLGIIQIETKSRQRAFKNEDLNLMTAVAGQVAVVIRNSELALNMAAAAAQRENLSRFLSPQLVDQVLTGKLGVELGGIEKKGTVFFSDIVSFTRMARQMSAQAAVTLLNRYFTVMQNIIFKRGGSIDKCAGDNIMAHWGIVGDVPDFTVSAATAAIEMQNALFVFNRDETRKKEITLPPVPMGHGIGLNTGVICAGNIGSLRKIEFTVIGDAVNLSARIESMAGRGMVFLGEPTWEELKDRAFCVRMPNCPARNVDKPLAVYSIRGIVPPAETKSSVQANSDLSVEDLLFSLPCFLVHGDAKTPGVVIGIDREKGGSAKLTLHIEGPIEQGTALSLEWNVPELPNLPAVKGDVEKCWDFAAMPALPAPSSGKSGSLVAIEPPDFGRLVLAVSVLPQEILAWKPGVLLQSPLKSHEEIVRA